MIAAKPSSDMFCGTRHAHFTLDKYMKKEHKPDKY
jgi:hypothetical protein